MKRHPLFIWFFILTLAGGCCHGGARAGYHKVGIDKLTAEPFGMMGRRIEVRGVLQNLGTNYFTDLKLVLMNKEGQSIPVSAWLPLSVPPPRPGSDPKNRPALISDPLGREVKLFGVWEKQEAGDGGKYFLRVEKHEIIMEGER